MNELILNENVTMSIEETQNANILAHLKAGKNITAIDALNLFGCFRLSARIYELRNRGYQIETTRKSKSGKNFAVYSLKNSEVA